MFGGRRLLNKSQDMLDWLLTWIEDNRPPEFSPRQIAQHIQVWIFGSVHTTSQVHR